MPTVAKEMQTMKGNWFVSKLCISCRICRITTLLTNFAMQILGNLSSHLFLRDNCDFTYILPIFSKHQHYLKLTNILRSERNIMPMYDWSPQEKFCLTHNGTEEHGGKVVEDIVPCLSFLHTLKEKL